MLNEEEADDLLYCSRAGETDELQQTLSAVLARAGKQDGDADAFRQLMLEVAEKNEARNTLLHFAAANDHRDILEALLPKCDVRILLAQNDSGNTALHWASLNGHLEAVQLLIKRFDEVEPKNQTAAAAANLTRTEDEEDKEAQKRSTWDVVNQAGMGPMSTAQVNGRDKVVSFLLEHMIHGSTKVSEAPEEGEGTAAAKSVTNGDAASLEAKTEDMKIN